jgi:CHAD domain-containing protein
MLNRHTPTGLLRDAVGDLLRELPNIREGSEEGFHQGRVVIRRIREALAVVHHEYNENALHAVERRLKRSGRALGRARDTDVAQSLMQHVESRFLPGHVVIGRLRATLGTEQLETRRRAIKEIEFLGLAKLHDELKRARRRIPLRVSSNWRTTLRQHVARRADEVRSAIACAGGVYFPNRVHAARVAVKRLRYALELAKSTRAWRRRGAIRVLKEVQSALGEAHDRDVAISRLDGEPAQQSEDRDGMAVQQFLRAETESFHAIYLKSRSEILEICDACSELRRRRLTANAWLLVASASVAIPSLLLAHEKSGRAALKRNSTPEGDFQRDRERFVTT